MNNNNDAYIKKVIILTANRRGNGQDIPIRVVKEVLTQKGNFIAEYDPLSFTIEEIERRLYKVFPEIEPKDLREKVFKYFIELPKKEVSHDG